MRALSFAPLALVLLAGCLDPPTVRYYSLRPGKTPEEVLAPAGAPVALVDRFAIDEAYADERLAYRLAGSHELGYDPYARWAGTPGAQVEDAVRDALRATGLFAAVRQPQPVGAGRSAYDVVVTGRVARLEEVDDEDEWRATLDLELYLLDGRSRDVLFSRRFARTAVAAKRNPGEVVALLARQVDEAVKEFAEGARAALPRR